MSSICRLCLQYIETGISNPEETITLLQSFLPLMNRILINAPVICETCHENVSTSGKLLSKLDETNTMIQAECKRLKIAKLNLKGFHKNVSENCSICRICLDVVNRPKIFLCQNSTNILSHDFLKNMMNFCNLIVDLEVSNKPVMCVQCWEHLQVTYTFKKNYLDVERKIREYCLEFKLRNRNLSIEILEKVIKYFSEEYCEIIESNNKQEYSFDPNICSSVKREINTSNNIPKKNRHVKTENGEVVKKEEFPGMCIPRKRTIMRFSRQDNLTLLRVYYEVTKNEQDFRRGYWKRLCEKWNELNPDNHIYDGSRLSSQIHNIIRRKLIPKAQVERIKAEISASIRVQAQLEQTVENYSDSDDSFMEEAVHSSFTPHVKAEPLNESDIEFNFIEPKLEVESDCESLPQLERMIQPHFRIENIYSLEVKREAYDNYMKQDEETEEAINKSRRESLRGHNKDKKTIECTECNFETTNRITAERHMKLHQRWNQKIYQCTSCPYRITDKWIFNRHMRNHRELKDEIPDLLPGALIPQ